MGIDQDDHETITQGLVSEQQREQDSRQKSALTPEQGKQEQTLHRIMKRQAGSPAQDTELAREQAAMKRRSSQRRTARGQIRMHGSLDQPER